MAESRYNLVSVNTLKDRTIQNQPWYKERLHTQYVKGSKKGALSQHLSSNNWIFMKNGLDDFRDGLPPAVIGSDFIKTNKCLGPTIRDAHRTHHSVMRSAQPHRFTKQQICFSRVTPRQQAHREHIDEIEYGLLQHPLALYPHLEESVPPEIFEDIVDLLDPEMNVPIDESHRLEDVEHHLSVEESCARQRANHRSLSHSIADSWKSGAERKTSLRNLYKWLPQKEDNEKGRRGDGFVKFDKDGSSSSEDMHICKVTREFCQWMADIGGSNNVEESTIVSLFASGYETKPALAVPIHVVELSNVPPELRMSASIRSDGDTSVEPAVCIAPRMDHWKRGWNVTSGQTKSWEKFRYGAWYLPPKFWQRRGWDEKLEDPMIVDSSETTDVKRKSHELDEQLSTMHASTAFLDFVSKKVVRKPEFLKEVAEIQRRAEEEERQRAEAEMLTKAKNAG